VSHIVYFIGGPLDLTKRAFPGEEPTSRFLRFPVFPGRSTYHEADEPIAFEGLSEVVYELRGPIKSNVWFAMEGGL
jgi:hypothetical protein